MIKVRWKGSCIVPSVLFMVALPFIRRGMHLELCLSSFAIFSFMIVTPLVVTFTFHLVLLSLPLGIMISKKGSSGLVCRTLP